MATRLSVFCTRIRFQGIDKPDTGQSCWDEDGGSLRLRTGCDMQHLTLQIGEAWRTDGVRNQERDRYGSMGALDRS